MCKICMQCQYLKNKISKFSSVTGVYVFCDARKKIIYVGKATNLKSRVASYFTLTSLNPPLIRGEGKGGRPIEQMIGEVADIEVQETDSVLEALILEANLIKKHQPKYNVLGKDDKSFSYFLITREEFPRLLIVRKTEIEEFQISNLKFQNKLKNQKIRENSKFKIQNSSLYGPYTSKKQMEVALKIIRKIFPFHFNKQQTEKGCLDFQIGLCPGPYAGEISRKDYLKNIRGIKMILEGKKKSLIGKMEKEMEAFSKKEEFEKAGELRNKIFALRHIQDIALISKGESSEGSTFGAPKVQPSEMFRIEAYDISNISGQYAVGSMVVFDNQSGGVEPNKNEYRKFKIKTVQGADDVGMMREVLRRRVRNDWATPDLVILDGGKGHLNMAEMVFSDWEIDNIALVAVAKGVTRKISNYQFLASEQFPIKKLKFSKEIEDIFRDRNLIEHITGEAHRFAIGYHRKLRGRNFKEN